MIFITAWCLAILAVCGSYWIKAISYFPRHDSHSFAVCYTNHNRIWTECNHNPLQSFCFNISTMFWWEMQGAPTICFLSDSRIMPRKVQAHRRQGQWQKWIGLQSVTFKFVLGHTEVTGNKCVDKLASLSPTTGGRAVDWGYILNASPENC